MQSVLQSGSVTPGHLTSWVTDGVLADAGVTYANSYGLLQATALSVNFHQTGETQILINLPQGYTRYRIENIIISGASVSLVGATASVWTGSGQTGSNPVPVESVTVSTSLVDTINNMQLMDMVNTDQIAFVDPALFFNVVAPLGSPATANVTVRYQPLP